MTEGSKADAGKPRMDLIDPDALEELAKVLTFGAQKYAAHKWRKGIPVSKIIASCYRHLGAVNRGDNFDDETGLQHAAHLMCEAMFLVWTIQNRPDIDDRWRKPMTQYKITLKDGTQMTVEGKSYREAMEGTAVPLHDIRNCKEIIDQTDDDSFGKTMRGMNGN